jgi:HEAT repeat protein
MIDIGVDRPGHSLRILVFQALRLYGTSALLPLLLDKSSIVSTATVRELQGRGGEVVYDEAVRLLASKLGYVRETAAFLLGQLGYPDYPFAAQSVPLLIEVLRKDKSASVRASAAAALGHLRKKSALPPLLVASKDGAADVRASVAFALSKFPRSVEAKKCLLRLARDRDEEVRRWASDD